MTNCHTVEQLVSSPGRTGSPVAAIWGYFAWFLPGFTAAIVAPNIDFDARIAYLVVPAYYLAISVFLTRYWYRFTWSEVGIPGKDPWTEVAVSITLAAGYLFISLAMAEPSLSEAAGNLVKLWLASKVGFMGRLLFLPIVEELFFRGVAFQAIANRYGTNQAIVLTSFLFAVAHFSLAGLPWLFLVGFFLALFVRNPGSTLFAPIIFHVTLNLNYHILQ